MLSVGGDKMTFIIEYDVILKCNNKPVHHAKINALDIILNSSEFSFFDIASGERLVYKFEKLNEQVKKITNIKITQM